MKKLNDNINIFNKEIFHKEEKEKENNDYFKTFLSIFIIIIIIYYIIPLLLSDITFFISNYMEVSPNPENLLINLFKCPEDDYITGRNFESYYKHLLLDYKRKNIISLLKNKKLLDLGSGLNHKLDNSLISILNKKGSNYVKGMDIVEYKEKSPLYINASLFNTGLSNNSIDIILSQYVLYSHINKINDLKKAFIEIYRILRKDGEIRIYPIYYGNYYLGNMKLKKFIDNKFTIKILNPEFYIDKNKILQKNNKFETFGDSYIMESLRHIILKVKTIVFIKK